MTAFDDILNAEQEAERSVNTAKEEVVKAVTEARAGRKTRIEAETIKLNELKESTLNKHRASITDQTDKIKKEVATKVASVEKKFELHKVELQKTLKNQFA